jgi:LuxR family transcriptional regulator, maltose regulon positive regulatory protein
VLDGLDFLLRNTGSGLRLVVASRMDPLLRLHRYRLAGELTEIRTRDLTFTTGEASLLMARHGQTLAADTLESLMRRTEGWAAGLRLAAISMRTHPHPDRFAAELIAEDSVLASYLVEEVLSTQPADVRDILLCTSILDHVSGEAATELTGSEQAAGILQSLAHANAFVEPIGGGRYRYHALFAEVMRLKLRRDHPDRIGPLHRRAARWYQRNGRLSDAVRHATQAGDWPLAAAIVIDELAIGEISQPRDGCSVAGDFASMPRHQAWAEPEPYLISAAAMLSTGQPASSLMALDAADGVLQRLPASQKAECQLAAALIRFGASRRTGDLVAAAAAASRARALTGRVPAEKITQHPEIRAQVLAARGAIELWSGHLDEAARILDSGIAAATSSDSQHERGDCLGHLALAEALRGRLCRAAKLASQATAANTRAPRWQPDPAAPVALAWVHLQRNELRKAGSRLQQAVAALAASPDKPVSAVACLVAALAGLAEGRAATAVQFLARARSGWSAPAWIDQKLSMIESRAHITAGDIEAALAAAKRADYDSSLEAAITLAHAWLAAGDRNNARHALAPALTALRGAPEQVRLQAWLADARLSYSTGDRIQGQRALAAALRLAAREQLRLPFIMQRGWIGPVLRHDPELAQAYQRLLVPAQRHDQLLTSLKTPAEDAVLVVEPLTGREREVLRHFSSLLSTAEIASEMQISIHTVKTHIKHIYRKLATSRRGEAVRRARQLELI